jgi:hypothetical protein
VGQPVSLGAPLVLGRPETVEAARAPGSWLAFWTLAIYATLRWGTMLEPAAQGRLFASLLLSLLVAGLVRTLIRRWFLRWAIGPVVIAAAVGLLWLAGFPLTTHVGHIASALSDGVNTFGDLLVPYTGGDQNVAAALVLSAGLLLLVAGVVFGSVTDGPGTARLALAAAPLLAVAIIPSTIVAPRLTYVHGVLTFALSALLVLSPRLVPETRGRAIALLGVVAVLGALGAGLVAGDRLWVPAGRETGSGPGTVGQARLSRSTGSSPTARSAGPTPAPACLRSRRRVPPTGRPRISIASTAGAGPRATSELTPG